MTSDDDHRFVDIDGDGDIDLEVGVIGDHGYVHLIPDVGDESVGVFDAQGELVAYAEDVNGDHRFGDDEWVAPDHVVPADGYEPAPAPANVAQVDPSAYVEPRPADVAQFDPDGEADRDPPMPDEVDAAPGPDAVDHGPWVSPGPELPADDALPNGETADPAERSDAEVAEDASHWFQQSTDFTCGPSAATALLADFFEVQVGDERELYATAQQYGLITEGAGMTIFELSQLISLYEVENQVVQYDIGQLDERLDAGYGVILFVDGNEYWNEGAMSDGGVGLGDANDAMHFIRVLDIDEANGVAIVSDSGVATGEGLEIPLDDLDRAWGEADHYAIATVAPDDDAAPAVAAIELAPDAPGDIDVARPAPAGIDLAGIDLAGSGTTSITSRRPPGWIILPIVASGALAARLLGRARTG